MSTAPVRSAAARIRSMSSGASAGSVRSAAGSPASRKNASIAPLPGVTKISERAAALDRVALAAATTDPEVGDVLSHHEALREEAFGTYVDSLAARGLLKAGMHPEEATDVLLTLTGSEVFLGFTEARGWPVDRYVAWLTDTLSSLLLRPQDS